MAARILEIVAGRGKMHNPETDSGGVLLGTVRAVGERFGSPPPVGSRIVTLASLTLTPLRLDAVTRLDPGSAQIDVTGTAYVNDRAPWGAGPRRPPARGRDRDLRRLRRRLAHPRPRAARGHRLRPRRRPRRQAGDGRGARRARRRAGGRRRRRRGRARARVRDAGLCDVAVRADLRDPLAALAAVRDAGVGPADLTVVVVNAGGCEPTAILLTADGGTVLFYSMATTLLDRRADRGRALLRDPDAGRQRLRARPRRLRPRAGAAARRRCAPRSAPPRGAGPA